MNRVSQLKKVQDEALELFTKKNTDYGDSFATYGPVGVLVRLGDKISRLNSITNKGVNLVNTESLRDTLIDLHNYAAMAVLLIDEEVETHKVLQHNRITEIKITELKTTDTLQNIKNPSRIDTI
tara:strand:+ start:7145 stop:7516 length:372 start_codon:yes stop_codon:yes gene_type:complete